MRFLKMHRLNDGHGIHGLSRILVFNALKRIFLTRIYFVYLLRLGHRFSQIFSC